MANPQPTDAHLRIAHSINEAIMMRDFTKLQRKVLDLILRLSWGCGKKDAHIPHQRDFSVVGVHETDIKAELNWLEASKVIGRDSSRYWFNKNFDEWQVSRVKPYQPEKLGDLLSINLNSNSPKLNKMLNKNLTNSKVKTKQNVKFSTPKLASPKESIKKVLNKDTIILPEWIDTNVWNAFLEMRKKMKAASTEFALSLIIKDLEKFKAAGEDPNEILKRSITNSWKGVFSHKGGQGGTHQTSPRQLRPHQSYTQPDEY